MRRSSQLDPVVLLRDIREAQAWLAALADATPLPENDGNPKADVEAFLDGLRNAWKEGEVRPTSRSKASPPRGRRRPDLNAGVTDSLRAWFDDDPSQTGHDLLQKLQAAHSGIYPDALLRTVHRRLKGWRGDMAHALVFGPGRRAQPSMTTDALHDLQASRASGHHEKAEPDAHGSESHQEHLAEATT